MWFCYPIKTGVALGPLGVFVGGAVGGVAAKQVCKAGERRAQRKYEQRSFQNAAIRSNLHLKGTMV